MEITSVASASGDTKLPTSKLFIDGTHVDHRCKVAFKRSDVDFAKFFAKLTAGTQLIETVYCTAPYLFEDMRRNQRGVINRLKQLGGVRIYDGRYLQREFKCRECGKMHSDPVEKGTDVAVATHLVRAACLQEADRLILVAGDNDYWPALEISKGVGADCRFAYFVGPDESDPRKFTEVASLRQHSRGFIKVNAEFMEDCWFQKDDMLKKK